MPINHRKLSVCVTQLQSPREDQRAAAATALAEFDYGYAESIAALLAARQDAAREVRLAVVNSLVAIWRALHAQQGESLPLDSPQADPDQLFEPVIPALHELLQDQDKYIRLGAAEALRSLYSANTAVMNVYLEAARDADEALRRRAAYAFWQGASELRIVTSSAAPFLGGGRAPLHDVDTEPVIAVLIELLQDSSSSVREYAARAIESIGPKARAAAPALIETLQDQDETVRFKAAGALASIGSTATAQLEQLVEALRDTDRLKRKAAAAALRAMGADASAAAPALIAALSDEEPRVRARCAEALGNIGAAVGDAAIHALIAFERDPEQIVRNSASRALDSIGVATVEAFRRRAAGFAARDSFPLFGFKPDDVPGLIGMLRAPNADMRAHAATALGHCGGDTRGAVPDLIALLKDEDPDVRQRASQTLRLMGYIARQALNEAVLSSDDELSAAARRLLAECAE